MKKLLKNPLFYLAIILVIALILRLLDVNKTSFWYDEAFTGDTVPMAWKDMFDTIAKDKVHPPLYYILTKFWGFAFGYSQIALRGFSVLWGMLTVAAGYFIGKEVFDKEISIKDNKKEKKETFPVAGIVLSTILAISPFFVAYSIEARSYAFLAFLGLVVGYTTLKYLQSEDRKEALKYLIVSILVALIMCFTHYLQGVYVIGLIVASLAYKYVYPAQGLNTKFIKTFSLITLIGIITLAVLPVKEFFASKGISGSWWVPNSRIDDIVRIYYNYIMGVVRYTNGVPIPRELIIPIAPQILGTLFFILHSVGLVLALKSKEIAQNLKRNIFFFYILSLITFIGFLSLSLFNVNVFVERYTIAPGIILIVSIASILSVVILAYKEYRKIFTVALLGYIVLIALLKPMPFLLDYRNVASILNSTASSLNAKPRYIYDSPADMINSMYYTGPSNAYYRFSKPGEYSGWALVNEEKGVKLEDIKPTDFFIVTEDRVTEYTKNGQFKVVKNVEDSLAILQRVSE